MSRTSVGVRRLPGVTAAWAYVVCAPFIAILTILGATAFTRGGGDFCDPVYRNAAERDADFSSATTIIVLVGTVMAILGAVVAAGLVAEIRQRRRTPSGRPTGAAVSLVAVCIAASGYILLATVLSDFTTSCG